MKMIKVISANILALMCSKTFAMNKRTELQPDSPDSDYSSEPSSQGSDSEQSAISPLSPASRLSASEETNRDSEASIAIQSMDTIDCYEYSTRKPMPDRWVPMAPLHEMSPIQIPKEPSNDLEEKHASPTPEPHTGKSHPNSEFAHGLMESTCMTVTNDLDFQKYTATACKKKPEGETCIEMLVCPVKGSGVPSESRYIVLPENSSMSIGRNHEKKYRKYPHMSRNHMMISRKEKGKGIMVMDCGSTNGTFILCGDQKLFRLAKYKQHSLTQVTMAGNGVGIVYRIGKERGWIKFVLHEPEL